MLVLASLAAVAPVSTDLYLPGFPELGDALGVGRERGPAHPHLVPGRARRRAAGDGAALGPVRAPYAADRQRRGLRGRGCGLCDGADPDRTRRRPAGAGLRGRRRHGHRPRGDRRPGDRHGGGQGVHADAHRRRRRPSARAAGRRRCWPDRSAGAGCSGRSPASAPRCWSASSSCSRETHPPRAANHAAVPRLGGGLRHVMANRSLPRPVARLRAVVRGDDGLHLGLAVRVPERRRPVRGRLRRRVRRQRRRAHLCGLGHQARLVERWSAAQIVRTRDQRSRSPRLLAFVGSPRSGRPHGRYRSRSSSPSPPTAAIMGNSAALAMAEVTRGRRRMGSAVLGFSSVRPRRRGLAAGRAGRRGVSRRGTRASVMAAPPRRWGSPEPGQSAAVSSSSTETATSYSRRRSQTTAGSVSRRGCQCAPPR